MQHYNQDQKRSAEFIKPPNKLRAKVGYGGLDEEILDKAQKVLENNAVDFEPLADIYINNLNKGIELAKSSGPEADNEYVISCMLYPAMQLKANGGMLHYQLVTTISDKLVQFLEVITEPDIESVEIVMAFSATLRAVIMGKIKSDGGQHGEELIKALEAACIRYFEKHPETAEKLKKV